MIRLLTSLNLQLCWLSLLCLSACTRFSLQRAGDRAATRGDWHSALQRYEDARALSPESEQLAERIERAREIIEERAKRRLSAILQGGDEGALCAALADTPGVSRQILLDALWAQLEQHPPVSPREQP